MGRRELRVALGAVAQEDRGGDSSGVEKVQYREHPSGVGHRYAISYTTPSFLASSSSREALGDHDHGTHSIRTCLLLDDDSAEPDW